MSPSPPLSGLFVPTMLGKQKFLRPLDKESHISQEPLVDSSSKRSVQWYFDNLLPEESARDLLAKEAKIDVADAFGLLAYYGAESAGSLTLVAAAPEP